MFRVQANNAVKKGVAATGSVLPIVHLSQSASLQSWKQLFQSFCESTTLYAAEIWGLPYTDIPKRCQTNYFKSILHLPRNTPDCLMRYDMGIATLKWMVIKKALRWYSKVLDMEDQRYLKRCLTRLRALAERAPSSWNNWYLFPSQRNLQ
ncbi:Endonuclease-reverse transcriptase HmRTE-e01 [Nesidiocoris tenuis]|uniref:Endonuclease-reverse transcriptase HmRTE-e01 n=1 Tax=Nesidiocoris tenuis TaxID=355587 RepID=A0ABN7B8P9_9HEMI|nr:Endonuclease-reverse transcriptase HmRTE-e01 [Nesidiocoris tenuis]